MNDLKTYRVYRFTRREQINVKKVIPRHGPEGSGNQSGGTNEDLTRWEFRQKCEENSL